MRNTFKWLALFALPVLILAVLPHDAAAAAALPALDPHTLGIGMLGFIGAVKLEMPRNFTTFDYTTLANRLKPITANAPEANIDVLYDTQTYLAAGVAQLKFFTNPNADLTLSNMELAGQLPANNYFDVYRIFIDANRVLTATVADTAAGVGNDLATILHAARGTMTWTQNNKPLGPWPITFIGRSGTVEVSLGTGRAAAAGAVIQAAGMPDNGGWPANGSLKIGPSSKIGLTLDFNSTAVAVDTPLRVTLFGIRYRSVS